MSVVRSHSDTFDTVFEDGPLKTKLNLVVSKPKLDRLRITRGYELVKLEGIGGEELTQTETVLDAVSYPMLDFEGDLEVRLIEIFGALDNVPVWLYDAIWDGAAPVDYIFETLETIYKEELSFGDIASFTRQQLESDVIDAFLTEYGFDQSTDHLTNGLTAIEMFLEDLGLALKTPREDSLTDA